MLFVVLRARVVTDDDRDDSLFKSAFNKATSNLLTACECALSVLQRCHKDASVVSVVQQALKGQMDLSAVSASVVSSVRELNAAIALKAQYKLRGDWQASFDLMSREVMRQLDDPPTDCNEQGRHRNNNCSSNCVLLAVVCLFSSWLFL